MTGVAAFPWASFPSLRRAEVDALRAARRWADAHVRLEAFAGELGGLLGAEVSARVLRAAPARAAPAERDVGVLLARAGAEDEPVLVAVEPALAAAVAARAMRRPPIDVVKHPAQAGPALAGALAAVVVAAARRAHAGVPLRVLDAGPARALDEKLAGEGVAATAAPPVVLDLSVVLDGEAFAARCRVAPRAARGEGAGAAARLAGLGPVPVTLPIVACADAATATEVGALVAGDVWIPGRWPLQGAELAGPVLLAAPGAATGVRAQLVAGERFVLSGECDAVCAKGAAMTGGEGLATLVEAVGDVPVVVRVGIGEATMTAREWAALGRGDVVTLGRRAGELVVLRVGDVPVARGELVTVDGEVGVRVVERFGGDTTRA